MRTILILLSIIALGAIVGGTPSVAVPCSSSFTADQMGAGFDDPNIPNCVAGANKNYAEGECEHVQQWLNFGALVGESCNYTSTSIISYDDLG